MSEENALAAVVWQMGSTTQGSIPPGGSNLRDDSGVAEREPLFKLPVFEGPMDLLLALIAKNKVNIYDIPIALILTQYMDYLHACEQFDLEIASEFIVMAADLMVLKSRLLLPPKEEQEEDPRQELVDLLVEYKRMKWIAQILQARYVEFEGRYEKPPMTLTENPVYALNHEPAILAEAFLRLFERKLERGAIQEGRDSLQDLLRTSKTVSVNERILVVLNRLSDQGTCSFSSLFSKVHTKNEAVATFLAVLELMKGKRIAANCFAEDYSDCELCLLPENAADPTLSLSFEG